MSQVVLNSTTQNRLPKSQDIGKIASSGDNNGCTAAAAAAAAISIHGRHASAAQCRLQQLADAVLISSALFARIINMATMAWLGVRPVANFRRYLAHCIAT